MNSENIPFASIGIPVFNGENFLRFAIESVLDQSFEKFELIISDNASTDATGTICEKYAAMDSRIKYLRNSENLGAGGNYNNCFYKASGKYFKWLAHDDMIDPAFLEKCIEKLESCAESVMCYCDVRKINEKNETTELLKSTYSNFDSAHPSDRFNSIVNELTTCEIFFSLFRRSALIDSELHGNYISSDKILLAEMALRGSFVKINEPLLLIREHNNRFSRAIYPDRFKSIVWFSAKNKSKPYRLLTLYRKHLFIINKNINTFPEKIKCYLSILRYMYRSRNLKLLFHDLVLFISPGLYHKFLFIEKADREIR